MFFSTIADSANGSSALITSDGYDSSSLVFVLSRTSLTSDSSNVFCVSFSKMIYLSYSTRSTTCMDDSTFNVFSPLSPNKSTVTKLTSSEFLATRSLEFQNNLK